MKKMFFGCKKLKSIKGLNNIATIKPSNLNGMFIECKELEYLDLSKFDTSNTVDISEMFDGCISLKEIKGINNFVTSNTNSLKYMFQECNNLEY